MEEEQKKTFPVRIPKELDNWINEIQLEFEKKRGFVPSKNDVLKNIVRQFKGSFIV